MSNALRVGIVAVDALDRPARGGEAGELVVGDGQVGGGQVGKVGGVGVEGHGGVAGTAGGDEAAPVAAGRDVAGGHRDLLALVAALGVVLAAHTGEDVAVEQGRHRMDLDALGESLPPTARLVFLCSPHNPVGRVWTREELTRVGEICLAHGVLVVADAFNADRAGALGFTETTTVLVFGDVKPEPDTVNLNDLLARATAFSPDLVVGFGGLAIDLLPERHAPTECLAEFRRCSDLEHFLDVAPQLSPVVVDSQPHAETVLGIFLEQ